MSYFVNNIYWEYRFSMGDANFVFFSNINTVNINPHKGILHSHKLYEMFHVLHGNVTLVADTERTLINRGDTVIIAPGTTHTTNVHPDTKRFCMIFAIEKNQAVQGSNYYDAFEKILSDDFVWLDSPLLTSCFTRCADYIQSDYAEKDELITACLHEIMALIKATNSRGEDMPQANPFSDTDNSRTYLVDHYFTHSFQHGSLTELSELLHLSSQQTQRIIKKMYGQSFSERLTMMKMQLAKSLLQETNLSVTQIAEKCGYTGPNGFFVAFKKYYGKTPNKLKKTDKTKF